MSNSITRLFLDPCDQTTLAKNSNNSAILWKKTLTFVTALFCLTLASIDPVFAQKKTTPETPAKKETSKETTKPTEEVLPTFDQFTPNPIDEVVRDALLPAGNRELSKSEREKLEQELDKLASEAQEQFQSGNKYDAFKTWFREIRLRRYVSLESELIALVRVGTIAWQDGRRIELLFVTQRLEALELKLSTDANSKDTELQGIAEALQQIGAKPPALNAFQKLLDRSRERGNVVGQKQALLSIGELNMTWLDYSQAAFAYEELLDLIRRGDQGNSEPTEIPPAQQAKLTQENALKQLAYIYEQLQKPQQAVAMKEQLLELYLKQQNLAAIPDLKISIADNYYFMGQYNQASQIYQEAYSVANTQQQFPQAIEALDKLSDLYTTQKQWKAALQIYQTQLLLNRRSDNVYGMMDIYDKIGQLYLSAQAFPEALKSFQKGLEMSQQLGGYRADYFTQRIAKVNKKLKAE
jgi:tetratricopeptide (TPR) repeat protein